MYLILNVLQHELVDVKSGNEWRLKQWIWFKEILLLQYYVLFAGIDHSRYL